MGCDSSKQDYPTKILHSPESWKTNGILDIVCDTIVESMHDIDPGSFIINPQCTEYIRLKLKKKTGRCWEVLISQGTEENYIHSGVCRTRQNEFQFFKMTIDNTFYFIMQAPQDDQVKKTQKKGVQLGLLSCLYNKKKDPRESLKKLQTAKQQYKQLTRKIELSEANKKHADLYAKKEEERANQRKKQ